MSGDDWKYCGFCDTPTEHKMHTRIAELESKLDRYEHLLATAYQLAGLVGAPVRFLDAYALHDEKADIESLLPADFSELDEFKALQSRLDSCLEGQEALKAQTVRIRAALTDERREGVDTEQIAKELVGRLGTAERLLSGARNDMVQWGVLPGMAAQIEGYFVNAAAVVEARA